MTENEALFRIKDLEYECMNSTIHYYTDKDIPTLQIAQKALEEIQQYRVIGTVEEFKDLKENSVAKKPIDKSKNPIDWHVMACPNCEHIFWNSGQFVHYEPKFCNYCGQKLDWQ